MRAIVVILVLAFVGACQNKTSKEPMKELPRKPKVHIVQEEPLKPLKTGYFHLEEKSFGKIIELKGTLKPIKKIFKVMGPSMLVRDNLLIVQNRIDNDMFMLFKLPELEFIRSFGKIGQGPGEFVYPSIVTTEGKVPLFYMFDGAKNGFCYLDRENQIKEIDFRFPHSFTGETPIHFFNNHELVYAATTSKGKAIFYCDFSGVQANIREVYDLSFSKKHRNWGAYLGVFAASKKKNRLVYAYKYFKRMVFLNLAGDQVRIVDFSSRAPRPGDAVSMMRPEHVTHYWNLFAGEKYLYLSYSGRTPLQVMNETKNSHGYIFIEQFDWNGHPIRKFKLDHWGYFCVDEKRNNLVVLSLTADDPFVVYDLPRI